MKGIILAGGNGSRLAPATLAISKQLLPIYDKPMVYYPLSVLMLIGVRDILLISTPADLPRFRDLLDDGRSIGLNIKYEIQPKPEGIAQALIIGEEFIGGENVCLILGDNVFYGAFDILRKASRLEKGARIFSYYVKDPRRYGVIGFDKDGNVRSIDEKPHDPQSNYVVTGLYMYDCGAIEIARSLKPSPRGELEITDVNRAYLERKELEVIPLGRGMAWLDTGTHESMLDASNFIATIEKRQGLKIACIEEIAYRMKFIDKKQFSYLISGIPDNSYRRYLQEIIKEVDSE